MERADRARVRPFAPTSRNLDVHSSIQDCSLRQCWYHVQGTYSSTGLVSDTSLAPPSIGPMGHGAMHRKRSLQQLSRRQLGRALIGLVEPSAAEVSKAQSMQGEIQRYIFSHLKGNDFITARRAAALTIALSDTGCGGGTFRKFFLSFWSVCMHSPNITTPTVGVSCPDFL